MAVIFWIGIILACFLQQAAGAASSPYVTMSEVQKEIYEGKRSPFDTNNIKAFSLQMGNYLTGEALRLTEDEKARVEEDLKEVISGRSVVQAKLSALGYEVQRETKALTSLQNSFDPTRIVVFGEKPHDVVEKEATLRLHAFELQMNIFKFLDESYGRILSYIEKCHAPTVHDIHLSLSHMRLVTISEHWQSFTSPGFAAKYNVNLILSSLSGLFSHGLNMSVFMAAVSVGYGLYDPKTHFDSSSMLLVISFLFKAFALSTLELMSVVAFFVSLTAQGKMTGSLLCYSLIFAMSPLTHLQYLSETPAILINMALFAWANGVVVGPYLTVLYFIGVCVAFYWY